jgi:hypothetical protein
MLVVGRMPFTLLGADAARLGASLHHRSCEFRLELGLPAEDVSGGDAHVAAVQAQPDAADQGGYVVLGEVSVRASGAALRAVEASLDARNQRAGLDRGSPRMRLDDLLGVSHSFSFLSLRALLGSLVARAEPCIDSPRGIGVPFLRSRARSRRPFLQ